MVSKRARFSAWSPVPHLGPYSSLERFPTQTPDNATHNQPNPQSPSHGRSFSLTRSSGRCCLVATFSRLVECDRSVPSLFDLLTSSPWSLSLLICAIQSPTARLCLSGSTWEPSHWVWLSPGLHKSLRGIKGTQHAFYIKYNLLEPVFGILSVETYVGHHNNNFFCQKIVKKMAILLNSRFLYRVGTIIYYWPRKGKTKGSTFQTFFLLLL